MGLLNRRPRPRPLEPPTLSHIALPDVKVLRKHADEIADFKQAAMETVRSETDRLKEPASAVVTTLLGPLSNTLGEDKVSDDDESIAKYLATAAIGLAMAAEEERRGWQRADEVDARVHTAIHFQQHDTMAEKYLMEAGYWYARTGRWGLQALVE